MIGVVFAKANIPGIYKKSGVAADDRTYAVPARELLDFLAGQGVTPVTAKTAERKVEFADALVRINCLR